MQEGAEPKEAVDIGLLGATLYVLLVQPTPRSTLSKVGIIVGGY